MTLQLKYNRILPLLVLALLCLLPGSYCITGKTLAAETNPSQKVKKIFILHSYEKNHVCGQPQANGVIEALKEAGFIEGANLLVDTYYMDTKKNNNTPELIAREAAKARQQIEKFNPDVLVTLDDNAFSKVGLEYAKTNLPVVFCGLNGQPETYSKRKPFLNTRKSPGANITGIYEKLHIADALRVQMKILPGVKKLRIIVDKSPTGKAIDKQILLELEDNKELQGHWDIVRVNNWEEYQKAVLQANQDTTIGSIYPVALLLRDNNGKTYTAPSIFAWTVKNSTKPELALNFSFTQLGLFGGAAVDFRAMGVQAGNKVAEILLGIPPGRLAIEDAKRFALSFNLRRAKELNITIPDDILLATDEIVK